MASVVDGQVRAPDGERDFARFQRRTEVAQSHAKHAAHAKGAAHAWHAADGNDAVHAKHAAHAHSHAHKHKAAHAHKAAHKKPEHAHAAKHAETKVPHNLLMKRLGAHSHEHEHDAKKKLKSDTEVKVTKQEVKVEKAKRWLNIPLPQVDVDHLKLDVTPEDPRNYLRTMYELIYLAFKTDTTRVATYQLGRENGVGISDYLGRAVGFKLTHQLSHATREPDGFKNLIFAE